MQNSAGRPVPVVYFCVLCLWCVCVLPAQRALCCVPVVYLCVLCLWSVCTASSASCACGLPLRPVVCLHSELCVLCLWCACTANSKSCACGVPAQRILSPVPVRPVPVVCLHVLCLWAACTASSDSECLDWFQGGHASMHTHFTVVCLHSEL